MDLDRDSFAAHALDVLHSIVSDEQAIMPSADGTLIVDIEGSDITVIEAMLLGLGCVIVNSQYGLLFYSGSNNGFLVAMRTPKSLSIFLADLGRLLPHPTY